MYFILPTLNNTRNVFHLSNTSINFNSNLRGHSCSGTRILRSVLTLWNPVFQFITPEPCSLLWGCLRSQFQKNPPSYRNLQSPLPFHFSGSWHYCWLFFRFVTPIVGKLFCPITFIYLLLVSCPFASTVDTMVSPTSNFIAFLPMCFCCSDTGGCKLPCQQLCCWLQSVESCWQKFKDQHHGWRVQSHSVLGFLCSPQSVSLASTHQFTPVSSYIHQWLLSIGQKPAAPGLEPIRFLPCSSQGT